jgi:hypothetical protein
MERTKSPALFAWAVVALGWLAIATPALAQPLGTFRWQFGPYCNIVTLNVVQAGAIYTLDGYDDQCGTGQRASVSGTAFQNPDGSIGIGLNLVLAPGGAPSHVDVTLQVATLGGTWRDSAGATGAFVFTPGAGSGGSPRPTTGSVGAGAIDMTQVQRRIAGACAGGEAVRAVNIDGSVACEPVGGGAGDISGVSAGAGLTGGGVAGDVALAVNFAGPGIEVSVARSDHFKRPGTRNTGVGLLTLTQPTIPGANNTALGAGALSLNVGGSSNTGIGNEALNSNVGGHGNTAVGTGALESLTSANNNSFVGLYSGQSLTTGNNNVAFGTGALGDLTTGDGNIALGRNAGLAATTGSNNIFIGNAGLVTDNATVRIGGGSITDVYMTGIYGETAVNGVNVLVNASGRLGTLPSSARFKRDISPVNDARTIVQALRPVHFFYRPEYDKGEATPQYGLIAEEVENVDRDLVVYGPTGEPDTVRYHFLPTLLVAEVQRLERERAQQATELATLRDALQTLEQEIARLRATSR